MNKEHKYTLRNIIKHVSTSPRGDVDHKRVTLPKKIADIFNYAYGLNGSELRLVKVS